MSDYLTFLAGKRALAQSSGFEPGALHPRHFAFQRDAVAWATRQGRAALFEDTGLGKTGQQIEWAAQVARHTGGRVLLTAPLAVAHQTIGEGRALDVPITYVRNQGEVAGSGLFITNYDRLEAFDGAAWQGVVLDESSILKSYTGKTKQRLLTMFTRTPYRLACTATPAPNDYLELGNHAEFLGIMPSNEMLMRWFINDPMKAGGYRLKGHAAGEFWQWVASWAACISRPSDLGYPDDGYALPPLELQQHTVDADVQAMIAATGSFVAETAMSATRLWKDKKQTAPARCALAADLVLAEPGEAWVLWVSTDHEADLLRAALPAALTVEVRGSDRAEVKEAKLNAFAEGRARYLITKPKIAGFGLNWQHCARMAFVGLTYSFEYLYQALRRCYRFGQARAVVAHLIVAETEANVLAAIQAKQEAHRAMQQQMTAAMAATGLLAQRSPTLRPYDAPHRMHVPAWLTPRKAA